MTGASGKQPGKSPKGEAMAVTKGRKEWTAAAHAKAALTAAEVKMDEAKAALVEVFADELPNVTNLQDPKTGLMLVVSRSYKPADGKTVPAAVEDAVSTKVSYTLKKGADMAILRKLLGEAFESFVTEVTEIKVDAAKATAAILPLPAKERAEVEAGLTVSTSYSIRQG